MKKTSFLLLLFTLLNIGQGVFAQEPYAELIVMEDDYDNYGILYFYYDHDKESREGIILDLPWEGVPEWATEVEEYGGAEAPSRKSIKSELSDISINEVYFDESFGNYQGLENTAYMFSGMDQLFYIGGLEFLNTLNVTDMSHMFQGCSSLWSLDLSGLETSNVTDMSHMFDGCSSLESLDLTSFNTSNVTDMSSMFSFCFNISSIYCNDDWSLGRDEDFSSDDMFSQCYYLKGAISYEENEDYEFKDGVTYANPTTGYFTKREAYAVVSEDNLTFYYGGTVPAGAYSVTRNGDGTWKTASFTTVSFDQSFLDLKMTSTANMFKDMNDLTTIDELTYLNTTCVKDMSNMFSGCGSLEYIYCNNDWSGLTVVSDNMFSGCSLLPNFDENNLTVNNAKPSETGGYFTSHPVPYVAVESMSYPWKKIYFYYDKERDNRGWTYDFRWEDDYPVWLENDGEDGVDEDEIKRVIINSSFGEYHGLKTVKTLFSRLFELDEIDGLEYLNTENVTDMSGMFSGLSKLTSLNLSHLNTNNVTNMSGMFWGCSSLRNLDLSSFNTENVTDMSYMFSSCSNLSSLDLSNFSTEKITNMTGMFNYCSNLATIFCNDNWYNEELEMPVMFDFCNKLIGCKGTSYSYSNSYGNYAHIDGGAEDPGYFTYALTNDKDNSELIGLIDNQDFTKIGLVGRTLFKDGNWNTLCLPFDVDLSDANGPLYGATVKTLVNSDFDNSTGTLYLEFSTDPISTIEAGKPYIIMWSKRTNIVNPVFTNVTINNVIEDKNSPYVDFKGIFNPKDLTGTEDNILYLGSDNKLYSPNSSMLLGAFRAYFQLNGLTAGSGSSQIKAFQLNFGDEENGIREIQPDRQNSTIWFSLDGTRLLDRPTQKGIYIKNGHKVIIK